MKFFHNCLIILAIITQIWSIERLFRSWQASAPLAAAAGVGYLLMSCVLAKPQLIQRPVPQTYIFSLAEPILHDFSKKT